MIGASVMQIVDTLDIGGTERVAVNIANELARRGLNSYLCTTRREGPLAALIQPGVGRLALNRKRTIEVGSIRKLGRFVSDHGIRILHAHGSSILTANLASRRKPFPSILWHDHFGTNRRSEWLYRRLVKRVNGIATVSQPLADWSRDRLRFPKDRVWCVPNFVESPSPACESEIELPGTKGGRVVCVANVRPVKDHITLLTAMVRVASKRPDAHLILVGALTDEKCVSAVKTHISDTGLSEHVTILGQRDDVPAILAGCDVGVLSSTFEGLPVSLLEYGAAGLAVVVTNVGQCSEVVGDAGFVVPRGDQESLADRILWLLNDSEKRSQCGSDFSARVCDRFGAAPIMDQWLDIYETVLSSR